MLNTNNQRELRYLVKVDDIKPIEGRDRVECAVVGGWTIMVKNNQFKPGDVGIFFEIDSRLPEEEPFLFLAKKHFKIKTQKYKTPSGHFWSQGLLMHPTDFGWVVIDNENVVDKNNKNHCLTDETRFLTQELKVTYAVEADNIRKAASVDKYKRMAQRHAKLFAKQPFCWLMNKTWGKKILFIFFGKKIDNKTPWPAWVVKTDEERIENQAWRLQSKNPWVATEKVDGSSTTFTILRGIGLFKKNKFYVCSRNVAFETKKDQKKCFYDSNIYEEMAEKYNIQQVLEKLLQVMPEEKWITIQGETFGAGVQKKDYHLKGHDFLRFNFITSTKGRWNSVEAKELLKEYDINWVPILDTQYVLPDTIEELREYVNSEPSKIDGEIKEGIVFRSQDGTESFKCVSPEFLVKYHS